MTGPSTGAASSGAASGEVKSLVKIEKVERPDPLLTAVSAFAHMRDLAASLVASGFLPKAINTPEKAIAVMLAGRELGVGPMIALRSIHIIDAKPVVAADLLLARFKADGGRAEFVELTDKIAKLSLQHPNGDKHVESFTIDMAKEAQLLGKDNWKKHAKAMLRSRVITAALKSIGYEPTAGVYTPDEAEEFDRDGALQGSAATRPATASASLTRGDETTEGVKGDDGITRGTYKGAAWEGGGVTFPYTPYKGMPLNAKYAQGAQREKDGSTLDVAGHYVIIDERLAQCLKWASDNLAVEKDKEPRNDEKIAYFSELVDDVEHEQIARRRETEKAGSKK